MGRKGYNFQWRFDELNQVLHAPSGFSITVREIAEQLQDRVYNRYDLGGGWKGWRVRGDHLIAPGGRRVTSRFLRLILSEQPRDEGVEGVSPSGCAFDSGA